MQAIRQPKIHIYQAVVLLVMMCASRWLVAAEKRKAQGNATKTKAHQWSKETQRQTWKAAKEASNPELTPEEIAKDARFFQNLKSYLNNGKLGLVKEEGVERVHPLLDLYMFYKTGGESAFLLAKKWLLKAPKVLEEKFKAGTDIYPKRFQIRAHICLKIA